MTGVQTCALPIYETPISTNMGMEFCHFLDALGYEFAMENFIAHFGVDEAPSVRMVFQTHEYNIKTDFGIEIPMQQEKEADSVTIDEQVAQWAAQIPATI